MVIRLAQERYDLRHTDTGEPFALARGGTNIALMLRGSREALRMRLARDFRERYGRAPSSSALTDAMVVLASMALDHEAEPVHLRVGRDDDGRIVLDLGRQDGMVVVVEPGRWHVTERSPIIHRRTALTAPLPIPERGGTIDLLRGVLPVTEDTWLLVVGWMITALIPEIPHPVLYLTGEQGSAKSTAARTLISVIDPSTSPTRAQPRDIENWLIAAAGSWAVAIDNISHIPDWLSDAFCRASTGDGLVRRKLYTDDDLSVIAYRRVLLINGIDVGVMRGDLGDRILLIDCQPISEARRRTEEDLQALVARDRPRILGALLDLLAAVLAELPTVTLASLPRMADFARVIAAMDRQLGTDALRLYLAQRGRVVHDVIDGDPVAGAVIGMADEYIGRYADLLIRIRPDQPSRDWPTSARALQARLRRLSPALRAVGVHVAAMPRSAGGARVHIHRNVGDTGGRTPPTQPSRPDRGEGRDGVGTCRSAKHDLPSESVGGVGRVGPPLSPNLDPEAQP
jgi:hypothetical protein